MKHIYRKHDDTLCKDESPCLLDDTLLKQVLLDILAIKFENPKELEDLKLLYKDCKLGLGGEIIVEMSIIIFSKIKFVGEHVPPICDDKS